MASDAKYNDETVRDVKDQPISDPEKHKDPEASTRWWKLSRYTKASDRPPPPPSDASSEGIDEVKAKPNKWSMGIMNDPLTDEVPGSILLMSNTARNEPLGLRNAPARTSASSLPSVYPPNSRPSPSRRHSEQEMKKTKDGTMMLEPQPDDSLNDPLNWPALRRDVALLSLGFFCMVGGGMTPVLAAGFNDVAETYNVSVPQVALTTGLYMMGLGLGCVVTSPTAILFGKRPVYLVCIILFAVSSVWCALSPNYASLVVARVFMGLAVSPGECLPSATIAEIFFLHERAYRLGIYTLLLLSGKNLVPLVSAAIIEGMGSWRWVFWIVAMVVGFCFFLMFFFVPETFWDRTPHRPAKSRNPSFKSFSGFFHHSQHEKSKQPVPGEGALGENQVISLQASAANHDEHTSIAQRRQFKRAHHVGFADDIAAEEKATDLPTDRENFTPRTWSPPRLNLVKLATSNGANDEHRKPTPYPGPLSELSPSADDDDANANDPEPASANRQPMSASTPPAMAGLDEKSPGPGSQRYTTYLRSRPPKTFVQTLKPWNGQLRHENWFKVALRPFILFAYPAILWSALVYSLSIGWLIVLSESVSEIYRTKHYHFSSLGVGLVYVSPFVGGILGTAVAGKVSDFIVKAMSRRNGGVYEPEFRLVMAIPVAISTCIGLMGFGWSAEEEDKWIVPTIFFGIISFGSSLGSTTAITFAVDSYRMYAGEGLVTLNFAKNIFHGLVFSLFFNHWLEADGSKNVFLAIGGIQLACLLTTIPMYIYGKRARMWTYRKNLMEKF
ncbi:MAG: hypothetical protein L6R42_006459 [Xanthoria sp. 1 TBL-2021]|nr:MAG: hypothetical protein L6R42_006459 [Xanthoria sp. 1 TBL-2021]